VIHEDDLGCEQCPVLKMKDDCIETLRAKLEKAEQVIKEAHNLVYDYEYELGKDTKNFLLALKEYRGDE